MNFFQSARMLKYRTIGCSISILTLSFIMPFASGGTVIVLLVCFVFLFQTSTLKTIKNQISYLYIYLFFALFFWCLISNIWSPEHDYWKTIKTFLLILIGILFFFSVNNLLEKDKKYIISSIALSTIVMSLIFSFESVTNGIIITNFKPIDLSLVLEKIGRGTVLLAMLTFPLSAFLFKKNKIFSFLFYSLCVFSIFSLPMTAALAGVTLGTIFAILCYMFGNKFNNIFFIIFSIYIFTAPFISNSLITIENLRENNIFLSSPNEHRIGIWSYTSKKSIENFPFGLGFDSSRNLGKKGDEIEEMRINDDYAPSALPLHPHNAILQIWLELGLIGIILSLTIFYGIIKKINQFKNPFKKVVFMSLIGSTLPPLLLSFGIWQAWWISTILISFSLGIALNRFPEKLK